VTTQTEAFGMIHLELRCEDPSGCGFHVGWENQGPPPGTTLAPEVAAEAVDQLWEIGQQHHQYTGHKLRILRHKVAFIG
jgi:hypothetical protein